MASFLKHRQQRRAAIVLRTLLLILILFLCFTGPRLQLCSSRYSRSAPTDSYHSYGKGKSQGAPDTWYSGTVHPFDSLKGSPGGQQQLQIPVRGAIPLTTGEDASKALSRLISLAPDELQSRNLLKPLEGTGPERIREIGLRVRSFKAIFAAWEDLHQIPMADGILSRDTIQSLYSNEAELSKYGRSYAEVIHSYDAVHSILVELTSQLFPWISPYSDPVSLHAQFYPDHRGIVITAGNGQAPYLLTMIPAIRNLGCTLPIEVMYLGDNDLGEDLRAELELLPGVTTRDLRPMVNDKDWALAGWAAKPFSILYSSFRHTILIDADSLFVQNPEVLFDDKDYQEKGALFFKDRFMMSGSKKKWLQEILPRPISSKVRETRFWTGEGVHMQESGVVVVDKWKHFIGLLMVARMNGPDRDGNDDRTGVYNMVYGDKETYWVGWELVGDTDYAFHRGGTGILGQVAGADEQDQAPANKTTICGPQLLHLDPNDRPLWFNGWLLPNKFSKDQKFEPVNFEAYIREPRTDKDPDVWKLRSNNICCLTSDYVFEFRDSEKDALQMTIDIWRDTVET